MKRVLTVTMNPALDISTAVAELEPGRKLRCERERYDAGGGGINIARVMTALGSTARAFIAVGGPTGEMLRELLEREGVEVHCFPSGGVTRANFKVVERASEQQFRFVLPGPELSADDTEHALRDLTALLENGCDYVIASGSLPPGAPADFHARLNERSRAAGAKLMLDTSGEPLAAALETGVYLATPNWNEAQTLLPEAEHARASPEQLARALVAQGKTEIAVLTLGSGGAVLATRDIVLRLRAPRVPVRSAVGAGDSLLGGIAHGLAQSWPIEDACRYGVAAGAAAVTTEATQLIGRVDVEALMTQVEVERLD